MKATTSASTATSGSFDVAILAYIEAEKQCHTRFAVHPITEYPDVNFAVFEIIPVMEIEENIIVHLHFFGMH